MNRGLTGVKVGDTLIIQSRWKSEPTEFEVVRVGRKYLYVIQYGREWQFVIETGHEVTNYGAAVTARTTAQYAAHTEREALMTELGKVGIRFEYGQKLRQEVTCDQLRAILAIVRPDDLT